MATLIRRMWRYAGLDRNPLRRASDRVESLVAVTLLLSFLIVGPMVAWNVGHSVYAGGVSAERAEARQRLRTVAVLADPADLVVTRAPTRAPHVPRATATWKAPDGTVHTGQVPVPFGASTASGATVPVWLDPRTGRPVDPPRGHEQTVAQTVAGALGTPLVMALLLVGTHRTLRHALDRRRSIQWQTAWVLVEPGWSRRRR
jgi:hypothetical protein